MNIVSNLEITRKHYHFKVAWIMLLPATSILGKGSFTVNLFLIWLLFPSLPYCCKTSHLFSIWHHICASLYLRKVLFSPICRFCEIMWKSWVSSYLKYTHHTLYCQFLENILIFIQILKSRLILFHVFLP